MALKLYPIGIQTFERIRKENLLYIDKTGYVYRMTHTSGKHFFLSRPRRFGKSLLVSTLESYFKADKEEQPVERIEQHYKHINMALQKFRAIQDEEMRNQENAQDAQNTLGAQVSTAVSLLNNFLREIDDSELYMKIVQLKTLAERGVITYIPKRLQRIQKDLRRTSGKARMTHDEALAEIIEMAKKYSPYFMAQESQLNEQETNAEIILSESFR